jgi:PsbN protein
MEPAITFIIFVSTSILGITGYSIYSAFGPGSKLLADPFEEHED